MEPAKPAVARLFDQVRHPIRLSILLALSEGDAGATELARRLGVTYDVANHALKQLVAAQLVVLQRLDDVPGTHLPRRIYRVRVAAWPQFVAAVERFAERAARGE